MVGLEVQMALWPVMVVCVREGVPVGEGEEMEDDLSTLKMGNINHCHLFYPINRMVKLSFLTVCCFCL